MVILRNFFVLLIAVMLLAASQNQAWGRHFLDPNATSADQNSFREPSASYTPWQQRRGQAYPGDFWRSFGRDGKEMPATLWDDTKAVATNPLSLLGIGLAGAAGISIAASGADHQVADHVERHGGRLNHFWDNAFDATGNPGTHFAIGGALYFTTLATGDTEHYEFSKTLINALAINGVTTFALKGIVQTRSPNGNAWCWPSGHTSSSFTLATVVAEEYGPWLGLPLFAWATMVGYERVDARNHDFSDVVSGALLGMAIGHAVAQNHHARIFGMEVLPYADPATGGAGVSLIKRW